MIKIKKIINLLLRNDSSSDNYYAPISRHVILAEYPKCGGTYLHSLINQILLNTFSEKKVTYVNNHIATLNISPDLDMLPRNNLCEPINHFSFQPLLLKTHQNYNKQMTYVICLYRDPLESLVSYYNMLSSYHSMSQSFEKFVKGRYGIERYCNFYSSYLRSSQSNRMLFINYHNTFGPQAVDTLRDLFKLFYAVEVSDEVLSKSLSQCSKDNYKKIEQTYQKYDYRRHTFKNINFISNTFSLSACSVSQNVKDFIKSSVKLKLPSFYAYFY